MLIFFAVTISAALVICAVSNSVNPDIDLILTAPCLPRLLAAIASMRPGLLDTDVIERRFLGRDGNDWEKLPDGLNRQVMSGDQTVITLDSERWNVFVTLEHDQGRPKSLVGGVFETASGFTKTVSLPYDQA